MSRFSRSYFRQYVSGQNPIRAFLRNTLRLTPMAPCLRQQIRALPDGAEVLDVGCGTGGFLQLVERDNADVRTVGLDIGAPPEFQAKGIFIHGSASNLPLVDNRFDLVTCSHVLEHLTDPYAAVAELVRVCKPGGYIYIETPSGAAAQSILGGTFWDDPTHIRPYPKAALEWMLSGYPTEILKSGHKRSFSALLFGFPYMLVGGLLGDKQARSFFPAYAFGFFAYSFAEKKVEN